MEKAEAQKEEPIKPEQAPSAEEKEISQPAPPTSSEEVPSMTSQETPTQIPEKVIETPPPTFSLSRLDFRASMIEAKKRKKEKKLEKLLNFAC